MNIANQLQAIEVRPTGRGRPVNNKTARARSAVIRNLVGRANGDGERQFTARDVAKGAKIGRPQVALALRWLNKTHNVVEPVANAPREERGRPELVYALSNGAAVHGAPESESGE